MGHLQPSAARLLSRLAPQELLVWTSSALLVGLPSCCSRTSLRSGTACTRRRQVQVQPGCAGLGEPGRHGLALVWPRPDKGWQVPQGATRCNCWARGPATDSSSCRRTRRSLAQVSASSSRLTRGCAWLPACSGGAAPEASCETVRCRSCAARTRSAASGAHCWRLRACCGSQRTGSCMASRPRGQPANGQGLRRGGGGWGVGHWLICSLMQVGDRSLGQAGFPGCGCSLPEGESHLLLAVLSMQACLAHRSSHAARAGTRWHAPADTPACLLACSGEGASRLTGLQL